MKYAILSLNQGRFLRYDSAYDNVQTTDSDHVSDLLIVDCDLEKSNPLKDLGYEPDEYDLVGIGAINLKN